MSKSFIVNDGAFEAEVLQADELVLTDFWAEWCVPCRMVEPLLDKIEAKYADQLKVVRIDADSAQELTGQLGIMSIPTLILFKNGQPLERLTGSNCTRERKLLERIVPHLT
ncbi:MAG: thioredoxin [Chloroflexota bacterium]|nr:thioredoxin [Chloroflexota bacterium]